MNKNVSDKWDECIVAINYQINGFSNILLNL